jgi:hypothetical protein
MYVFVDGTGNTEGIILIYYIIKNVFEFETLRAVAYLGISEYAISAGLQIYN